MNHFQRHHGTLHAEDVALDRVAAQFGTPTYVYAAATIRRHVQVLHDALGELDHLLCYAMKACGNQAVLELLLECNCGLDAVSVGELARGLKAGADGERMILSGVGKRDDEIDAGLAAGVLYICVESADELEAVAARAAALRLRARVAVRVNPDVDAKTHPHIATALKNSKFGVPYDEAPALFAHGRGKASLDMVGVTCHIGSQVTELKPFEAAAKRVASLAKSLRDAGAPLRFVGMGGGLGIPYHDEQPPSPDAYGASLARLLRPLGLRVVLEPGRVIVGNAAVLLCRVVRTKQVAGRRVVLVDAGMNDLLRPALYGAYHEVEPVAEQAGAPERCEVAGPVCESADTLARDRVLPPLVAGDLIAIRSAGAYGFSMASNYNGRPRPAEVLCDGTRMLLVRRRETLGELWRGEFHLDGTPLDDALPHPLTEDPS